MYKVHTPQHHVTRFVSLVKSQRNRRTGVRLNFLVVIILAETQVYLVSGDTTVGAWQAWLADPLRILIEMSWLAYIPLFAVVILCANEGGALRIFTKKNRKIRH